MNNRKVSFFRNCMSKVQQWYSLEEIKAFANNEKHKQVIKQIEEAASRGITTRLRR